MAGLLVELRVLEAVETHAFRAEHDDLWLLAREAVRGTAPRAGLACLVAVFAVVARWGWKDE